MVKDEKKIAVLLACYNGREWIRDQIDSIESQTGVSVDIYVSLDVSSDNTKEIIEALQSNYPNIKLLDSGIRFWGGCPEFFLSFAVRFLRTI